ncbi:MAG: hypothetical protein LBR00_06125 [Clostridiales Family XIII bacterium]|nr:hypothetical protein [Clostridiales Family XIII bacterium]
MDTLWGAGQFGDLCCLYGGVKWHTLARGTREQTVDEVKKLIDDAAAGGGLIIGVSHPLEDVKRENVEAMFETARSYGKK